MADDRLKYVIMVGPQGAGKGTQAAAVAPELGLRHVATGDLFRAILKTDSELGDEVRHYYDQGALVPDDLTTRVLLAHIENLLSSGEDLQGVLLDGFPRNRAQAEALDKALADRGDEVTAVVHIDVPRDVLMDRLTGRLICSECGTTYHKVFNPPPEEGACDACGGTLYQRSDDTPEAVTKRLDIYYDQTEPILEHYRRNDTLIEIDGNQEIDQVTADILKQLKPRVNR